jgi:two-component system cell cycle response regulator DivK
MTITNPVPEILYVEDNPLNMLLVRRLLTRNGFIVHEAMNESEAMSFLAEKTPDLILMDINLPKVDGYTITSQIRDMAKMAHVPIIALTANALRGDHEKSIAAGCNGYITKPIDVDTLPQQLLEYLR